MRLALDAVFPFLGPRGAKSKCRVRVYEPDEPERDAHVVVASELLSNTGTSITNVAEVVAAEIAHAYRLPTPLVYIEHYPPEATDGRAETFELVVFASWESREIARLPGELIREIGRPIWKRVDRRSVEILVGQALAG
ncbi:MAG: hypothetical protein M3R38_04445 [Actinomycetota bacterium]|nr:hypothetical protein [Actinomycetota bacterium]MDP9484326.1 hypothetical protein [Actinomycetota bacterium]